MLKFQEVLVKNKVFCFIRTTRGDDSDAACGEFLLFMFFCKSSQIIVRNNNLTYFVFTHTHTQTGQLVTKKIKRKANTTS